MGDVMNEVLGRAVVELKNLPSCAVSFPTLFSCLVAKWSDTVFGAIFRHGAT